MVDILQNRMKEIQLALEQSAANHNALIGRLNEIEHLLEETKKLNDEKESIE